MLKKKWNRSFDRRMLLRRDSTSSNCL